MTRLDRLRSQLDSMTADEVGRLLAARPDVLRGAPLQDTGELAERLVRPNGVAAALGALTWPVLQVLEVLTACGAGATEKRAAELLAPVPGPDSDPVAHARTVAQFVDELRAVALVWPTDSLLDVNLDVNPGVRGYFEYPLGLGRSAEATVTEVTVIDLARIVRGWGLDAPARRSDLVEAVAHVLGDAGQVRRLVGSAPAEVADYLVVRAEQAARRAGAIGLPPDPEAPGPGRGARTLADYRAAQRAAAWSRENGLGFSAWSSYSGDIEVPGEVLLALLPVDVAFPFAPVAPPLPRVAAPGTRVTSSAAGALTGFVSSVMATLESVDRLPLAVLKSGGIGVREIRAVAKRLGIADHEVRLALEIAAPLELVGQDPAGVLRTRPRFDQWRAGAPAFRAADLILIWFGLGRTATRDRDEDDRSVPVLGPVGDDPRAQIRRRIVLAALEEGAADTGVISAGALASFLAWRSPLAVHGALDDVALVWSEAERLGVAAHGTLSEIGRAVLVGDTAGLLAALMAALPPVQRTALFGSDLTVLVSGSPDVAVVDLLDTTADRETRGAASTWRITPGSVRRALDDGFEAADLLDRLRELADGPLPQPLEYLVRDVGRRYGAVRVGPSGAVLVGDDQALLAELAVNKALLRLGLQRIAPTVLVATAAPAVVVEALRAAGYLPRHVDATGNRVVRVGAKQPRALLPAQDPLAATEEEDDDDDLPELDDLLDLWAQERRTMREPAVASEESAAAAAERLTSRIPPPLTRATSVETEIAASAPRLTPSEVRQLARAIARGEKVQIDYRSSSGKRTVRILSEVVLDEGYVAAWCHLRQAPRVFALGGILAVFPG